MCIFVSPDYAFVIIMPPQLPLLLQIILVCALQARILIKSLSNSSHMSFVPSLFLFCALCPLVFSWIFFKCAMGHGLMPSTSSPPISDICGHKGANFVFHYVHPTEQSFQSIFFEFTLDIHWTKIYTRNHFCHSLVTFVANRGPPYQEWVGPRSRPQYIFVTH